MTKKKTGPNGLPQEKKSATLSNMTLPEIIKARLDIISDGTGKALVDMIEEKDSINPIVAGISNRISEIEGGDINARIAKTLLNEPSETPAEIAELEAIPDEDESNTEFPKMEFALKDGPMKNLHVNHINANENRENQKS